MIRLVPAVAEHVAPIAAKMREMDRLECAAFGRSPAQALRLGIAGSDEALTALLDGEPEAMMGMATSSALGGLGHPWFLGSDEVYRHPRAMLALGPKVLARWRDSTLSNVVARENHRAIRLLKRWGFAVGEEVTMIGGTAFLTFTMEG